MAGITYSAYGDGNCAFNAFTLALCDAIISGKLDGESVDAKARQEKILKLLRGVKDWAAVKAYLHTIKTPEQLKELQKKVASTLRGLALKEIEKNEDQYQDYQSGTLQALQAAFSDYKKFGADISRGDDIFRRHAFILEKFKAAKALRDREETTAVAKVELQKWWKENEAVGFNQFLNEMKKSATYAGDLELVSLARYFDVTLNYARGDNEIGELYKAFDENAVTITLRNDSAAHWNYEAGSPSQWPVLRMKSDVSEYVRENYINPITQSYSRNVRETFFNRYKAEELTQDILDHIEVDDTSGDMTDEDFAKELQAAHVALYQHQSNR